MNREATSNAVKVLLKIASTGAVIGAGAVAPNAIQALERILPKSADPSAEYKRLLRHMQRIGLVHKQKLADGKAYISLTKKGQEKLRYVELEDITLRDEDVWDGTWHIVTFDIPAKNRKQRNEVNAQLKRLGMYNFQRSLWAYPYSCESEVQTIADALGANSYFIYMQARLDDEAHRKLLKQFVGKLKSTKLT